MGKLQVLPANIANMIAAGEVVQRPASAVKELMENAVDAGATSITVIISGSGRTLIQVIDNGCGMSRDDAVLCFERHATSKIATEEDLHEILTYGFRGEALASIAAVADVTLKTRKEGDESATMVEMTATGGCEVSETAAPVGSNFAVRNLFYNVPARRKFLKSDNVEFKHIVEEFTRVALTRPDVAFSLSHNGRDIYVLKAAKSLKFRVLDLLGTSVVGDVVDIDHQTALVKISGFVGRPDTAKKTLGNQFLFVNGRYFRSAYLHKAVMKAYEGFIPEGVTPSYFLYLEVDPESIDVNIHPTKTEIKFEEDSLVFQVMYACIKETLGRHSFGASIDFDTEGAVEMPVMSSNFSQIHSAQMPVADFDPGYNPFDPAPGSFERVAASFENFTQPYEEPAQKSSTPSSWSGYQSSPVTKHESYGKLFEDRTLPSTQVIILQGRYIVTPARSGLMIVHIRRAQERVLFERFLRAVSHGEHVTQSSLYPVQVSVGTSNRLIFDEHAKLLESLGFDIVPVGDDTIMVNGVPEGYSCESGRVQEMVSDLMEVLSEDSSALPDMMASAVAQKFARLGAAQAADVVSPFEAQHLIDQLLSCENAEFSPSGHRIITISSIEEMDNNFR